MQITPRTFNELATGLRQERKRQGLSRNQAAAVCNVSPSFIRDAETHPERCTLERLTLLTHGLGLSLTLTGWKDEAPP
jgi:transcriptional regulator with XRE-family HTH domain